MPRLRPMLPDDELPLQAWYTRLHPQDVRLFVPMQPLSHVQAARFTRIDYYREMALVLTDAGRPGRTNIHGVVRVSADPDNEDAERAVILACEKGGTGLGTLLMRRVIGHARARAEHAASTVTCCATTGPCSSSARCWAPAARGWPTTAASCG